VQLSRPRLTRPWLLRATACAILVLAVGLAVASGWRPPAAGGTAAAVTLTTTDPADGAALVRAPGWVELSFAAAPDPDVSHVSVRDASGTELAAGRLRLVGPQRLRQPVHATAIGVVAVAYHVIFTDGRELAGILLFSVGTGGGAEASAAVAAAEAGIAAQATGAGHQHGVDPVSAALLALDGIVVLAVVVLLLRRPPPRRPA
jgi:methionine-rich copper-binding protein CopC